MDSDIDIVTIKTPVTIDNLISSAEPIVKDHISLLLNRYSSFRPANRNVKETKMFRFSDNIQPRCSTDVPEPDDAGSCLSPLKTALYATLIENALVQLRILDDSKNDLKVSNIIYDMDSLRKEKYDVIQAKENPDISDVKRPHLLGSDKNKLDKLIADRRYCTDVLLDTYVCLALKNNYDSLSKANSLKLLMDRLNVSLQEEQSKNALVRNELKRQIRQNRNHFRSQAYDADTHIEQLKSNLQDLETVSAIRSRYMDKWQKARTEQNTQAITSTEYGPSANIKYFRGRCENELVVHSEVENVTNIIITETLGKIEQWMEKYEKDIESVELKIQIMKTRYDAQNTERIEMEKTLESRASEITNWMNFKNEREEARLYQLKMNNAAIALQSWWRGLLVRLQLGPYKPVKKRPAPAQDKKKK